MRKFQITSPKFTGAVEITYNDALLSIIDFSNASLDRVATERMLEKIPTLELLLKDAFTGTSVSIIQLDVEITFEMFFNAYGKKVKKKRAEVLFNKLPMATKLKCYFSIKKYNQYLANNTWQTKADPDSFIREERWEDTFK